MSPRRQFASVLFLGAAGAGGVVLAAREAWARAVFTPPRPLPAQDFAVTGQQLVPLASALALAALACLAAVIATRSAARRGVGALLAGLGAGAAAAVSASVRAPAVLAAARASAADGAVGGSTTGGAVPGGAAHAIVIAGSSGHVVMAGAPWRAAAVVAAAAVLLAGLATVGLGARWPVLSSRFDPHGGVAGLPRGAGRPVAVPATGGTESPRARLASSASSGPDPTTMWEALSRDVDPTERA